jgi:phosphoribosylanthranilate isomerase
MIPKVKICCISSQEEAALAIKYGASALGLVGPMPSGPGIEASDTQI